MAFTPCAKTWVRSITSQLLLPLSHLRLASCPVRAVWRTCLQPTALFPFRLLEQPPRRLLFRYPRFLQASVAAFFPCSNSVLPVFLGRFKALSSLSSPCTGSWVLPNSGTSAFSARSVGTGLQRSPMLERKALACALQLMTTRRRWQPARIR